MYIITKGTVVQDMTEQVTYLKQNVKNKIIVGASQAEAEYVMVTRDDVETMYPLKLGYEKTPHLVHEVDSVPETVETNGTWTYVDGAFNQDEALLAAYNEEKLSGTVLWLALAALDTRMTEAESCLERTESAE